MRLRIMLILGGALLAIGTGCRECGCGGGQVTSDQGGAQTKAPTTPPSNPLAEQQATSLSAQPDEAPSASAPAPQKSASSPMTDIRQTIPEPQVTDEEIDDPSFSPNLPRASRRTLIMLRKLQESGKFGQPNVQASPGSGKPHDDRVRR